MYINDFDTLLNNILDKLHKFINSSKKISGILKTPNFVSKQQEITNIIIEYISSVNLTEFKKNITDEKTFNLITNYINQYIAYYIFAYIGIFHDG